jgi:hypothetical protein
MTYRELFAVFEGRNIKARRDYKLALFAAWHAGNFSRAKKLPPLKEILDKLDPPKKMSTKELRSQIMGIAAAMGAKVTKVPKGEFSMFGPKPKA